MRIQVMKYKALIIVGFISAAAAVLFLFNPEVSSIYPTCPLNKFTGLYCPGCGTQRAAHEILHGNIAQAFSLNALFTLSVPFAIYYCFIEIFNRIAKTNLKNLTFNTRNLLTLLLMALVFMILRNIDHFPFNCLAP